MLNSAPVVLSLPMFLYLLWLRFGWSFSFLGLEEVEVEGGQLGRLQLDCVFDVVQKVHLATELQKNYIFL